MALGASFDFAVNRYIAEPTSGNTPPSFGPVRANGKVTCQTFQVGSDVQQFPDAGLTKAKTYQYRVRAFNAVGPSAWLGPEFATTLKR